MGGAAEAALSRSTRRRRRRVIRKFSSARLTISKKRVKAIAWLKAAAGARAPTVRASSRAAAASPARPAVARRRSDSTVSKVSRPSSRVMTRPSALPNSRMAAPSCAISRRAEAKRRRAAMQRQHEAPAARTKGKIARLLAPAPALLLRFVPRCWTALALACVVALPRVLAQDMPIAGTTPAPATAARGRIGHRQAGADGRPLGPGIGHPDRPARFHFGDLPIRRTPSLRMDAARQWVLRGPATLRDGPMLFTADEIHYNQKVGTIAAMGHVAWTSGAARMLASSLVYNPKQQTLHAENVRVGRHPFYVSGVSAEGPVTRIVIHQAEVTYNEPGRWRPTIRADTVIYSPGHYLRLGSSRVGVGGVAMIPVLSFGKKFNAGAALDYVKFSGGYRSSLGATGTAALRIPVSDDVKVGGDLSIFTARGLMAGPAATYQSSDASGDLFGYFDSGFISDYGSRTVDILGNPIPHARAYAEWRHQEQLTDDLTVDGDFNWWRDSEVLRDFRPKEFYTVQEPDNFVESVYSGTNIQADAFTRFQANSFDPVQERLPELRFDLLPTAIGGGIYARSEASAVQLIDRPPGGTSPELADDRLDMFYGFSRPFSEGDWFDLHAGRGRPHHQLQRDTVRAPPRRAATPGSWARSASTPSCTRAAPSTTRTSAGTSTGCGTCSSRTSPTATSPRPTPGRSSSPTSTSRASPPTWSPWSWATCGTSTTCIRSTRSASAWTTRSRPAIRSYGSRDLLTFNVAEDLLFTKSPNDPDSSEIHTDSTLKPTKWLKIDTATIFRPRSLAVREVETGITIHDADVWSVHFGNDFLRRENDDYVAEVRIRLNEVYSVHLVSLYDERQHLFPEQSFALEENLVNTWSVRYVITLSSGPNRSGHFGANVQFDLIKF